MQVSLWYFAWGKYLNDTMGPFYTEFMLDIQTWYELDMIEIICAYQHLGSNSSSAVGLSPKYHGHISNA